jgi:predicted DNA-binding protein with PD1-like motif
MKTYAIEKSRHFVFRAGAGEALPDALVRALADQGVVCGWVRASGVLADVELQTFNGEPGSPASARKIAGPVHALSVEGSVGLDRGEPSVGLRAVLARGSDRGMEILGGEIVAARVVALEVYVTAFEDLTLARTLDPSANVTLFGDASDARRRPDDREGPPVGRPPTPPRSAPALEPTAPAAKETQAGWGDAIAASVEADARPAIRSGAVGGAIPARPIRRQTSTDDSAPPEPGDAVEHFAFGRADVVKSDGDRLHLRAHKDGRIREIALEMLKVTPLESNGPNRLFKLDRKL